MKGGPFAHKFVLMTVVFLSYNAQTLYNKVKFQKKSRWMMKFTCTCINHFHVFQRPLTDLDVFYVTQFLNEAVALRIVATQFELPNIVAERRLKETNRDIMLVAGHVLQIWNATGDEESWVNLYEAFVRTGLGPLALNLLGPRGQSNDLIWAFIPVNLPKHHFDGVCADAKPQQNFSREKFWVFGGGGWGRHFPKFS